MAPTTPRAARRLAVVVAAAVVATALAVLPALAHGGIVPQPRVTDLPDGVPGLEARGLVAYSPRIQVTNDSDVALTVVDRSGRPWLELSADGVRADLSVRKWYESLDPTGRGVDPPADAPTGWTQVSALPTWEWFDTVLLPRTGDEDGHVWSIPVVVDGAFDEIAGVLEESELEGRWATDLTEPGEIGAARISVVSGPVPVFVIQRLDADEVVVIGRLGEPLLRLTAEGFEANRASPSWNDHARLDPEGVVGDVVEDPDAEPVWELLLEDAPVATWLDVRAASPDLVPSSRGATVIEASIPVRVDGVDMEVPVRTQWVGDEVPLLDISLTLPTLIAASLGAGLLAAGGVRLWERRRGTADEPDDDGDTGEADRASSATEA